MRARAILAFLVLAVAAEPAAAQSLVLRVDQATAVIDGNGMIVTARGAVRTGGWERPQLVLRKSKHEPGDVDIAFVATPPQPGAVVAQSIVPVQVSMRTRLPKNGVAAVRVVSETNSVTAQIIPKFDRRRTARR